MRLLGTEYILIASGVLLLLGNFIVFTGGSFFVWTIAKVLYVLGVAIFLIQK